MSPRRFRDRAKTAKAAIENQPFSLKGWNSNGDPKFDARA
jgi:hypothetical protein